MTQLSKSKSREDEVATRLAATLQQGLLFVDAQGEVLWMDSRTRRRIDGGLSRLSLPVDRRRQRIGMDCFLTTVQLDLEDGAQEVCVLQLLAGEQTRDMDIHDVLGAVEEIMAEPSWLTQPLLTKLQAKLQAGMHGVRSHRPSELERLTSREREILALVCEGCTDAEMGRVLNLSQNTVRNHLASLFRKIGVNRRSAAVIWARERAITKHDILAMSNARAPRSST